MAPLSMYRGEAKKIILSRAAVSAFGGLGATIQKVVVPESLETGAAILRIKDADLHFMTAKDEKVVNSMHLDLTGQRVEVSERGGCKVLTLKYEGSRPYEPVRDMMNWRMMGPSVVGRVARRVAEGLQFFMKLGKVASLPAQWYATDSDATAKKKSQRASVGPSSLLDSLKTAWGCKMVIRGISSVLWYLGIKNTLSSLHLEDLFGESFFLLLKGGCKIWICIPARYTEKLLTCLEKEGDRFLVKALFEKELILPLCTLDKMEIPYFSLTQEPGDLVVTSGIHEVRQLTTSEVCRLIRFWVRDSPLESFIHRLDASLYSHMIFAVPSHRHTWRGCVE